MRRLIGLILLVAATATSANITAFGPPTGSGIQTYSSSFSANAANGSIQVSSTFDNHWLFTLDSLNPIISINIDNYWSTQTGAGTVFFNTAFTLTGPGLSNPTFFQTNFVGHRNWAFNFLAPAGGTYDLHLASNSSSIFASYFVSIAAIPEPAPAWLFGAGIAALGLARAHRGAGKKRLTGGIGA